jgi:hypothetical protein
LYQGHNYPKFVKWIKVYEVYLKEKVEKKNMMNILFADKIQAFVSSNIDLYDDDGDDDADNADDVNNGGLS